MFIELTRKELFFSVVTIQHNLEKFKDIKKDLSGSTQGSVLDDSEAMISFVTKEII